MNGMASRSVAAGAPLQRGAATPIVHTTRPTVSCIHKPVLGNRCWSDPRIHQHPQLLQHQSCAQRQQPRNLGVCRVSRTIGGRDEDGSAGQAVELSKIAVLGLMFVAWYGTSIFFNIYNKQLFAVFPFPLATTNIQFAIGSVCSLVFWATGIVKLPKLDLNVIKSIYPLAMIHVLGNVLTNVSLGHVAVSFTHTVKAAEPFFSVMFSALFLGTVPPLPVLATLVPIVGGVVIASFSEATFNWTGFLSAILSNITFQSRNVLSKKLMITKGSLDSSNMFQVITIMSFFLLLPISMAVELAPIKLAVQGFSESARETLIQRLLAAGLCFHSYQMLSYSILSRVQPVTHSIGNCVKRVVVIVASLIIFQTAVSAQNAAGTALALFGVFLYSQAKRKYKTVSKGEKPTSD